MNAAALPRAAALLTHRAVEVPLRSGDRGDRFVVPRHRVLMALTHAHGTGSTVAVTWIRTRPHGPVRVLMGGVSVSNHPDGPLVALPAGTRATTQDQAEVGKAMSSLTWERARLAVDPGSMVELSDADRLEDLFLFTGDPMAFLVVAAPLGAAELSSAIDVLSDEVAGLENQRSGRGVHRRQLDRAERHLEYLDQAAGAGCWTFSAYTAGVDAAAARAVTGMLAGTADVAEGPIVLRPSGTDVASQLGWDDIVRVGTDAVAALVRPPFVELPGLRVTQQPDFDQNVEDTVELALGSVLDGTGGTGARFGVSLDSVNRHAFVSGATGSGKSETVRSLLLSLNQRRIPWLVIEPAKAEYADLAPWLDPRRPLVVIRPGDPSSPPPMINPLEPSSIVVDGVRHTFPLQTHLDMVKALFTASFDADEPFPQVLSAGLTRAYAQRGWNLVTSEPADPTLTAPEWPVLGDLVRESLEVVDAVGYAADVRSNVRGFIRVRVESLRTGTPGRFFEGGYPVDLDDLLKRPSVFEVEDLGDDRDKAFLIGALIIRVVELLRLRRQHGLQSAGLAHVLVIEEAHRLLRRVAEESPAAHAVTMFANLLAEIRAYGEGVVVAEQIPAKVIPDLVKNSAVKIMHRLPAEDDRDVVGSTMSLSDAQSEYVVALRPGVAVAHSAGMDRPVLVRIDRVNAQPQTGAGRAAPPTSERTGVYADDPAAPQYTLAELETARGLVAPAVSLWVELALVAHLAHDQIGTPRGPWFDALKRADERLSRCALGLAVSDSIGRRFPLVRAHLDPAALARQVVGLLAQQLATGRGLSAPPIRWAVGQYTLRPMREALRADPGSNDATVPHPETARWLKAGVDLPGPTWAEQLAQSDVVMDGLPQVFQVQMAGSPAVLDELARQLGEEGGTEDYRIKRAVHRLGLASDWLGARTGAANG